MSGGGKMADESMPLTSKLPSPSPELLFVDETSLGDVKPLASLEDVKPSLGDNLGFLSSPPAPPTSRLPTEGLSIKKPELPSFSSPSAVPGKALGAAGDLLAGAKDSFLGETLPPWPSGDKEPAKPTPGPTESNNNNTVTAPTGTPPHPSPATNTTNTSSTSSRSNSTSTLHSIGGPVASPSTSKEGGSKPKPLDIDPKEQPPSYATLGSNPNLNSPQFQSMPDLSKMQGHVQKALRDDQKLKPTEETPGSTVANENLQQSPDPIPQVGPPRPPQQQQLSPARAQNLKDVANVLLAIDSFYHTLSTNTVGFPPSYNGVQNPGYQGPYRGMMPGVRPQYLPGGTMMPGVRPQYLPTGAVMPRANQQLVTAGTALNQRKPSKETTVAVTNPDKSKGKKSDKDKDKKDKKDKDKKDKDQKDKNDHTTKGPSSIEEAPPPEMDPECQPLQGDPHGGGGGGPFPGGEQQVMTVPNPEADDKAKKAKAKLGQRPKWSNGVVGNVLNGTLFATTVTQLSTVLEKLDNNGIMGYAVLAMISLSIMMQVATGCILVYLTVNNAGNSRPHKIRTCNKLSAWLAFGLFLINVCIGVFYIKLD